MSARIGFRPRPARAAGWLAALLAAGCGAGPLPDCDRADGGLCMTTRVWDFEDDCTDALCGFAVTAGEAQIERPVAFGVRVLTLGPGAVVEDGVSFQVPSSREAVALLARCDAGTSLRIEQTVYVWREVPDHALAPETVLQTADVSPGPTWGIATVAFPRRDADAATQRVTLRFAAVGPGRCSIDEIDYGSIDRGRVRTP